MRRVAGVQVLTTIIVIVAIGCGSDAAPPPGMVFVPAGTTEIGSNTGTPDERPVFSATVPAFFLDKTPVTVEDFRQFADSTGYVSQAEQFGDGGALVDGAWVLVPGASWERPLGEDGPSAPDDHPVTQVSWNDATAYCAYIGKRLPTEVEWEHAARGATNNQTQYAWGNELEQGQVHKANTWQGSFPVRNTGEDGYLLTSPVGAFGETSLGLVDIGGNVWEWTDDWYRSYGEHYDDFVPTETSERIQRGGSFLCNPSWCHGYRVSARSHSTPETSLFHVGFRCAMTSTPSSVRSGAAND